MSGDSAGKRRLDPLEKVVDSIYIVKSKPFEILKKTGRIGRKFRHDHPASDVLLTKLKKGRYAASEMAGLIERYVRETDSFEMFGTDKPRKLLEFYLSSEHPALFKELRNDGHMKYLPLLKSNIYVKSAPDRRLTRKSIEEDILSGNGITRFLTGKAAKLMNDLNAVFTLMAYYSASHAVFKSVEEDPEFWNSQLHHLPHELHRQVSETLAGSASLLKHVPPGKGVKVERLRAMFQVRTSLIPLARLDIDSNFVVEGSKILNEIEHKNRPEIFTIGLETYVKNKDLLQEFYPVGIITSNTLQVICRKGMRLSKGRTVKVLNDPRSSEWFRKQEEITKALGVEEKRLGDASSYREVGAAIVNQGLDMAVVPAPLNFLAGCFDYETVDLPDSITPLVTAVLLVHRDISREKLGEVRSVIDSCRTHYSDFANRQFEHFLTIDETRILNDFCRKDLLGLQRREFTEYVTSNRFNISVK